MKDHLSYYKNLKTVPTVDLKDLNKKDLFKQRFNFYFKLGITKNDLKNKNILEMCPGAGHNAYYLVTQCKIKKIKLIDKNPGSLKSLKKNLSSFKNVKIINSDVFIYNTLEKFDYTILENTIDGFGKPEVIFKKLCKLTKKDGVMILTFPNLYGLFSIKLKYLYALMLIEQNKITNFNERVMFLIKVFNTHLKYLSTNTRKTNKWIIDNILNNEWITKTKYFDYFMLKKLLEDNFLIKSLSLNFLKDYIWYKNMDYKKHNSNIFNNFFNEQINFLDFETKFECNQKKLSYHIKNFTKKISKFNPNKKIDLKKFNIIYKEVCKINKILNKLKPNNKIYFALSEFIQLMDNFKKKKKISLKTKNFYKFWGIGMSQITLYKTYN